MSEDTDYPVIKFATQYFLLENTCVVSRIDASQDLLIPVADFPVE